MQTLTPAEKPATIQDTATPQVRDRRTRESNQYDRPMSPGLNRTGITVGTLLAGCHIFWALLVLWGWAQPLINFVFWAHMIQPVYVIKPFNPLSAATLVGFTFVSGYLIGVIGAFLWTQLHSKR